MVSVLFVCTGNICRSPSAEGVFQHLVDTAGLGEHIEVDSAGTHDYHAGEPPDRRSQQAAARRGYNLSHLRAREVDRADFQRFDYLVAMDQGHYRYLRALCPRGLDHKVKLFLDFAPHLNLKDVPDPYYGGAHGFENVLDLIEEAARGLLAEIQENHL